MAYLLLNSSSQGFGPAPTSKQKDQYLKSILSKNTDSKSRV